MEKIQRVTQKILFEKAGKYLMFKDTKDQWELPGGTIDLGEDAGESMERELLEEMGLRAEQYEIKGIIGNFKIVKEFPDKHYHYLALIYKGKLLTDKFILSDEHTEYGWFSLAEINKLQKVDGYQEYFDKME